MASAKIEMNFNVDAHKGSRPSFSMLLKIEMTFLHIIWNAFRCL